MNLTIKEAEKELLEYKRRLMRINLLKIKIRELEEKANGNGSMSIKEVPIHNSSNKMEMKDFVHLICDLKIQYQKDYLEAEMYCCEVLEKKIQNVAIHNVLFANILSYKYVHDMRIDEIANTLNYSIRQTYRMINNSIMAYCKANKKEEEENDKL